MERIRLLPKLLALAAGLAGLLGAGPAFAALDVVVSIKPVHSLVAAVMDGLGAPGLLVEGADSPHTATLRPSEAKALSEADVILWVGEDLETFLVRPLRSLARGATVVELSRAAGIELLETREGGIWELSEEKALGDEAREAGAEAHGHGTYNMHLWLDPRNARAIVRAAVDALAAADPENAAAYAANGAATIDRLEALDAELAAALAPVKHRPYIVFHDAYPYFERRYGLSAVGSLTLDPDRAPGARRLAEIRRKMRELGVVCLFTEPQFEPAIAETLIEGTPVRKGVLDPLGTELAAGPAAYFELMRALATSLTACLAPDG